MKALMVMFDSLNLRMLGPYGCDWIQTPNFNRLASKSVTFESNYAGSLPCMPARRELHTGRYNFLHRSWGPIEPFDVSVPEILKNNGVYSHLVSDHHHYWEDGGATYHNRYSSWEGIRGQEGDNWKTDLGREYYHNNPFTHSHEKLVGKRKYDFINRNCLHNGGKHTQTQVFDAGLEFLETNHNADNWFLQIESFDPHEPFYATEKYRRIYTDKEDGLDYDWPPYRCCSDSKDVVDRVRKEYAALVTMCDSNLGRVLDFMDEHGMWKDTMLIVNTDHGYLLGEHGWWAKNLMPLYEELVHTPLFIYDPRTKIVGEKRFELTQTIDIPTTLLDFFGIVPEATMQGRNLHKVIAEDKPVRSYAVSGYFGGGIHITDGRYAYLKAPISYDNQPLCEYTLMPTHLNGFFTPDEMEGAELVGPLTFTKGCKIMRIPVHYGNIFAYGKDFPTYCNFGTKLFDLSNDREENNPLNDEEAEARMLRLLIESLKSSDCPAEQFKRLGIPDDPEIVDGKYVLKMRETEASNITPRFLREKKWTRAACNIFNALPLIVPATKYERCLTELRAYVEKQGIREIGKETLRDFLAGHFFDSEGIDVDSYLELAERIE